MIHHVGNTRERFTELTQNKLLIWRLLDPHVHVAMDAPEIIPLSRCKNSVSRRLPRELLSALIDYPKLTLGIKNNPFLQIHSCGLDSYQEGGDGAPPLPQVGSHCHGTTYA